MRSLSGSPVHQNSSAAGAHVGLDGSSLQIALHQSRLAILHVRVVQGHVANAFSMDSTYRRINHSDLFESSRTIGTLFRA